MTCDDDAHPISGPGRVHAPSSCCWRMGRSSPIPRPRDPSRPVSLRRSEASGSATALRGVGARAGHRLRFSLPAGSDRLAQRTRSGGRSVPCRRVHSLSVAAARKLRSRLLRRPQTVDSAPLSSASIRCLRRRNVASSIPMAASSSSLLCCPLVGHETRRRTYPLEIMHPCRRPGLRTPMESVNGAKLRCQLAAARPCAKLKQEVTRAYEPTLRAVGGVPGRLPGRYR